MYTIFCIFVVYLNKMKKSDITEYLSPERLGEIDQAVNRLARLKRKRFARRVKNVVLFR